MIERYHPLFIYRIVKIQVYVLQIILSHFEFLVNKIFKIRRIQTPLYGGVIFIEDVCESKNGLNKPIFDIPQDFLLSIFEKYGISKNYDELVVTSGI